MTAKEEAEEIARALGADIIGPEDHSSPTVNMLRSIAEDLKRRTTMIEDVAKMVRRHIADRLSDDLDGRGEGIMKEVWERVSREDGTFDMANRVLSGIVDALREPSILTYSPTRMIDWSERIFSIQGEGGRYVTLRLKWDPFAPSIGVRMCHAAFSNGHDTFAEITGQCDMVLHFALGVFKMALSSIGFHYVAIDEHPIIKELRRFALTKDI